MLRLSELTGAKNNATLTPEQARVELAHSVAVAAEARRTDVLTRDLSFAREGERISLRLYSPLGLTSPAPGILYLHGGGWVTGDLDVYDSFCQHLAGDGRAHVMSVAYRLAPEHRFPSQVEDCVAAWRWFATQLDELGIDRSRVCVAGDSAGGKLATVVARETAGDAVKPALQVLMYPALDATFSSPSHDLYRDGFFLTRESIDWYLMHYAGPSPDRRHPRLSPLLSPLPPPDVPAVIYTAGLDPLRDDGLRYADRFREANVAVHQREFGDMVHGFLLMGGLSGAALQSARAIRESIARVLHAKDIRRAVREL